MVFSKTGDARFLSHHDLLRLFERACRRAGLPVRRTEGFNPRPRLFFPSPCPTGVEGLGEILEIELSEPRDPGEVGRALAAVLGSGVRVERAVPSPGGLRGRTFRLRYSVSLPDGGRLEIAARASPDAGPRLADLLDAAGLPEGLRTPGLRVAREPLEWEPDGCVP